MKKRIVCVTLVLCAAFSLSACSENYRDVPEKSLEEAALVLFEINPSDRLDQSLGIYNEPTLLRSGSFVLDARLYDSSGEALSPYAIDLSFGIIRTKSS
jgi:hypothetical protein